MTATTVEARQTGSRGPLMAGWLFTAVLAALTPMVWFAVPAAEIGVGFELSWLFVALTVFASESLVIHLEYRKDAHSFSMGETDRPLEMMRLGSPLRGLPSLRRGVVHSRHDVGKRARQ